MRRSASLGVVAALAFVLSGCVTGPYPGTGYPGAGYPGTYPDARHPAPARGQLLEGQVLDTDHRNGRFMIANDRGHVGQRVEVYYDQRTSLVHRGQRLSPQGLERGDVIRVHGEAWAGRFNASHIEVLRDVRDGGIGQANLLEGTLRHVDARNRIITLAAVGHAGPQQQVRYDARTRIEDRGRLLRVEQLRPGDALRIEMRRMSGVWIAERIQVVPYHGRY